MEGQQLVGGTWGTRQTERQGQNSGRTAPILCDARCPLSFQRSFNFSGFSGLFPQEAADPLEMSSCHHTESMESVIEVCSVTPGLMRVPVSHSVMSHSLRSHGQWPASLLCPWNSSGKNTGVACHSLLWRIS